MGDYVYTTVPGKIRNLLSKIREVGVPPKASAEWLKSIGFVKSNDPSLVTVLRFIGLVDATGVPTESWRQYRGSKHRQVLGSAVRAGYAELFAVYPDAHAREASEIEHVVSTSSGVGKQAVAKTVRTFQNLCSECDFTAAGQVLPSTQREGPGTVGASSGPAMEAAGGWGGLGLHIDIQVHISPEASLDQIDKIFESMAKHLYSPKK